MPGFVKISIGVLLSTAIAVVLLLYFSFGSRIEDAGYSFSDSIHYLFMADYFFGARDAATRWVALNAYHPPFFPLFLGAFGGGAEAITLSHLLTYSRLAICAAASFWWFASVGLKVNERLALVMLFLVLPGTFLQSMMIVSEYLFLTLEASLHTASLLTDQHHSRKYNARILVRSNR